ncbi:MAG TPA: hypothetical protein VD929_06225 [Caulobacteraceae bacterium]|nr:hypothetical protein [Caulobacteraceae bacterium]
MALAAAALTGGAAAAAWWFEEARRLSRAMKRVLKRRPEVEAVDPFSGRAAGLDFDGEAAAVLWDKGGAGLVYRFDELDGAELIVDGAVAARVRRGEQRRALDALSPNAGRVTLRLLFADPRWPEFELDLWEPRSVARPRAGTPEEAVKAGRKWLTHVEAVFRRPSREAAPEDVEKGD